MRYELGALLGRGGMAEVCAAVARGDHGFERRVAIKRLLPEVSGDATMVRMFLDEARIAGRLNHAGIVSVLDYGEAEGVPFQVLELVEGRDAAWLARQARPRSGGIPEDVALHIVTEVAYALAYAHSATDEHGVPLGIVHRDVKPSNVLVSWGGDVKLGDFGIALARERCAETTGFVARGTPGYMSPEQLIGGAVDATTDTFALGCTLHGLLTGRSPLTGEAGRSALLLGDTLPLSDGLSDDIREIIAKAVKRRPEERYATAQALGEALGQALARRLRTDAKTRLLEWLEPMEKPSQTNASPTTEILSSLAGDDRRFTKTLIASTELERTNVASTELQRSPADAPAPASSEKGRPPEKMVRPSRGGHRWLFAASLGGTLVLFLVAAIGAVVGIAGMSRWRAAERSAEPSDAATVSPLEASDGSSLQTSPPASILDASALDASAQAPSPPPRSPPPRSSGSAAAGAVAKKGGRCWCKTDDGEVLCPREHAKRNTDQCACERPTERLCPTDKEACNFWSFKSASGFGGETCTGVRQSNEGGPLKGTVVCSLCYSQAYEGSSGAFCRGLSGKGGAERAGRLGCFQ